MLEPSMKMEEVLISGLKNTASIKNSWVQLQRDVVMLIREFEVWMGCSLDGLTLLITE